MKGVWEVGVDIVFKYIYLTAKETHIFNFHLIPETLIKFYPK